MSKPWGESEATLEVRPLYQDAEKSVARVVLRGLNARTINCGSTTTYGVLEGSGTMEVDGVFHELETGDVITVPRGVPYQDMGELVMLAISQPPFDPDSIRYI